MSESKSNHTGDFLKQGGILAVASLVVRFIGLVYRIPMSNILGEEGNGIYAVAFEIYDLVLIISSYSLPLAMSKIISAQIAKKEYKNSSQSLRVGLLFATISGCVFGGGLFIGASAIEKYIYPEYIGVHIPLRVLAPTIVIVAFLGVFRGYFQGKKTMMPTAISQIIEQVINAIVSVLASYLFMKWAFSNPHRSAYGAAGGTLGTCLGAAFALLLMLFIYSLYRPVKQKLDKNDKTGHVDSTKYLFRVLLLTIFPVILSQTVYNISGLIDYKLFGYFSAENGVDPIEIKSMVGVYSSKYRVLCSVPIALSTALASSMIPSAVAAYTRGDMDELKYSISSVVKFNMIIAFPCAVGYTVLGQPIVKMLFSSSNYIVGGRMLLVGSAAVVFYALSNVTGGALQSVDKMSIPVINSAISLALHVGIVILCLKFTPIGIYSLLVGNITFPLVVYLLNMLAIKHYIPGYKQEIVKTFVGPLAASLWMAVGTVLTYQVVGMLTTSNIVRTLLALLMAVIVYFIVLLSLNTLKKDEIVQFPFGYRIYALAHKLGLI